MERSRLDSLTTTMFRAFQDWTEGAQPTHLSRAPGRVNLIGEHTDYNGLPVMPMALQRDVRMVYRPRDDHQVRFLNIQSEYPTRTFHLTKDIPTYGPGDWGNYLKAPGQALVRRFGDLRGFDAVVGSTLPAASGLSSSSALVIAGARALLDVNDVSLPVLELAEEMARAERYTGTQGGGMDQAISLGAREGHASRIEFEPLRLFQHRVPEGWRFVVAHTLIPAEKSGAAQAAYNRRRQECRAALERMRRILVAEGVEGASFLEYPDLLTLMPVAELVDRARSSLSETIFRRFRHVVREALRVYEAEEALDRGDLLTFGLLMDASHESLRDDYEVSSVQLDRLVELARRGGAAGARLTGAGFGGSVVALVERDQADQVLGTLADRYYRHRGLEGDLADVLFIAEPSAGASVRKLGSLAGNTD